MFVACATACKNAFNSLRWNDTLNASEYNLSVPHYILATISSYLSNRQLVYNTSLGPRVKHITSGGAQGSGILRKHMLEETFLVGYTDDIAAVITARNTDEAQGKLRRVMLLSVVRTYYVKL